MAHSPNSPFKPMPQQQAVATLFLIENSEATQSMWSDLQDRYLPSIVAKLEKANPMAQVHCHNISPPQYISLLLISVH